MVLFMCGGNMQEPRGVGRPVDPNTEPKQDTHLWLKRSFLKRIDSARGKEGRTAYIIRVLTEHLDRAET
jgi:hypothetical protein